MLLGKGVRVPATQNAMSTLQHLKRSLRLAGMRPLPRLPARNPIDLAGKRILLTGASSGIGAAAAEQLAAEGAFVIAVARRAELLDAVIGRIRAAGGEAVAMPANLADLAAVDALVAAAGPVDMRMDRSRGEPAEALIRRLSVPELADVIRQEDVPAIFTGTSTSPALAETLADEVGGDVAVVELYTGSLGEPGSDGATYLDATRSNLDRIAAALGGS